MCGITAISANKEALPFLLQGLEKLEYRGYDSAGITTIEGNHLKELKPEKKWFHGIYNGRKFTT